MNKRQRDAMGVELGKRLKAARELAELTQEEVGARVGKSDSYVSESETGRRKVKAIELVEFARIYRQPLAFFVEHL